jgi:hypothetical protein
MPQIFLRQGLCIRFGMSPLVQSPAIADANRRYPASQAGERYYALLDDVPVAA